MTTPWPLFGIVRVVDVETTGFAPPEHRVIEAGWCDVTAVRRDLAGSPVFDVAGKLGGTFVDPHRPIPPESSAVHHLIDADLVGAPDWPEVARRITGDRRVLAFAAHTAKMERQWLTPDMTRDRPWICTHKCALRAFPDAPAHSNQTLRYWLNPPDMDRELAMPPHRAMPDAYVTAFLLRALLERHPVETLIQWTEEPAVLIYVPFGENRGKRWSQVDDGLLDWVLTKDFEIDVVHTVKLEIARREKLRREEMEAKPVVSLVVKADTAAAQAGHEALAKAARTLGAEIKAERVVIEHVGGPPA